MKLKFPEIQYKNFRAADIFRRRAAVLLFIFFAAISPSAICARTLAKYREDVKDAKILAQTLIYTDVEEMSPRDYVKYERNALAEIRASLPPGEKIEWRGVAIEIDNRWLSAKLDEFEKESKDSPKREAVLTEVAERLDAIEQKLNEVENPSASIRTKDEDKQKLAEVLRREEYLKPEKPQESLFQKMWRKLKEWLSEMFPHPMDMPTPDATGFQSFSFVLQMLLYALVLGIIGFLIYRFAPFFARKFKMPEKKKKHERVILGERIEENETAQNLFAEAERMASAGNLRGAIRKGYVALLCDLSDRKIIGLARHKTNRDYLRDVGKERALYENMHGLTENFERHWYGFESVEEKDWNEFKSGYKQIITNFKLRISN